MKQLFPKRFMNLFISNLPMNNSLAAYLGFASKAGKLSCGMSKSESSAKSKKAKLILIANDVSEKSKKEMIFIAGKYETEIMILSDVSSDQLEHATGRRCSVVAVNDNSFSAAIKEKLCENKN